ncbi:MAG: hypothetical protein KAT32_04020 [Candidatus Moranbacteria bacterium]|nr:hypothetical protein [Candidatus Moranbacteria bacterium]
MKKIIKYFSGLFVIVLSVFVTAKNAFADMLPPGKFDQVPKDQRTNFFDIIQPQYVLIGITIIIAIGVSFALIAKLREVQEKEEIKSKKDKKGSK